MSVLRFGIIGTGNIAPVHVAAIRQVPEAELVAVVGQDRSRTESFARRFGVECEDDYRKLLRRSDIDVVAVCTPHHLHAPMTKAAAEAGKHVLCEKPMARSLDECDEMIAACRSHNVALGVILQSRFDRLSLHLKTAIDAGRLGKILWASSSTPWYRDAEYYRSVSWRGTWEQEGGGVLINQAVHSVDLLLWLAGTPSRVTARMRTLNHEIEVEDSLVAILEYPTGHLGVVEATTNAFPGYAERLEFHGTLGSAVYHKGEARLEWHLLNPREDYTEQAEASSGAAAPMDISIAGHVAQFQDFAAALRAGRSPIVDGKEGRRSIALISSIYRSACTGASVDV